MAGAATGWSRSAPRGSPGRAEENLSAALAALAEASGWADRPAFVEAGTGVLSHGEVHDLVARVAGVLADHGVAPGARVLLALADGRWFPAAFLGTVHLGGIAVPVNPGLPEGDHAWLADDADPAVVVCEPGLAARFGGSRPVLDPGDLAAAVASRDPVPPHPVGGEAIAYAQYTSGTTGRPKAALHRHRDPRCYHRAMGEAALGIDPGDRVLSVSKAYFAYGLGNSVFFPLFSGASAVLWPARPSPEGAVALAGETRPTLFFAVPSFYAALVARAEP
ncbi:MAG TPA: AMP-binding protein, partial [Acidimicrobiales bacterium]|nr:AMP-binding protein [Acidimicrobiales bacterium]